MDQIEKEKSLKVQRSDGGPERRILIGCIVNIEICQQVAALWTKEGLFKTKWGNIIGKWCVDHYNRYGKAPRKHITGLFEKWAEDNNDEDTIGLVEKFLETLSGEYSSLNKDIDPEILMDEAEDYFNGVRAARLQEKLEEDVSNKKFSKAIERIETFKRIRVRGEEDVDLLSDFDALERAFEADKEPPLIDFGDTALQEFYKTALKRKKFVAFMAMAKAGKTRQLLDLGWRGLEQHRRVAYFAIGDETVEEMGVRFAARALQRPVEPGIIEIPISLTPDPSSELKVAVEHMEKEFTKRMSVKKVKRFYEDMREKIEGGLRLACYPSRSVTVDRVQSDLDRWERTWGCPDICIIDYADNLGGYTNMEARDSINESWQKMRGLSQDRPMLMLTATQSDAASYDAPLLKKKHFSNDRRKIDHVTAMCGINVRDDEKKLGLHRLNWLVLRKGKFSESQVVFCAGCPAIENPTILSTF
jgi:hypothetical protein